MFILTKIRGVYRLSENWGNSVIALFRHAEIRRLYMGASSEWYISVLTGDQILRNHGLDDLFVRHLGFRYLTIWTRLFWETSFR